MKIGVIGCGGIGSYLAELIHENNEKGQVDADVTLIDDDMVELNQIKYQNFIRSDIGRLKAEMLGKRYGFKFKKVRVIDNKYLKGYDLIVLCVDNNKARKIVYDSGFEFIDLRATGRRMLALPRFPLSNAYKLLDDDSNEYSCQEAADLKEGRIQLGNRIIATIGMLREPL